MVLTPPTSNLQEAGWRSTLLSVTPWHQCDPGTCGASIT